MNIIEELCFKQEIIILAIASVEATTEDWPGEQYLIVQKSN
jgi:hypothetical protein